MSVSAHANWLVDEARWHVSAHGQVACLDCHADIPQAVTHPHPGDVNKRRDDFFRPEQCEACHGTVVSEIKDGAHAGKPLQPGQDYLGCLDCHDPHYPLKTGDSRGRYNASLPARQQCGACHDMRENLPKLAAADEACMACHRGWDPQDPSAATHARTLCLACHGPGGRTVDDNGHGGVPLLDMGLEGFVPHREISCLACHPQAARFEHSRQTPADCLQCHVRHDEKVAHDVHLGVACGACHLKQVLPLKDRTTGIVGWVREKHSGVAGRLHHMRLNGEEPSCRRCHRSPNAVAAAAMVLPAKSILCMPCHAATFTVSDTTTLAALIVFAAGLVLRLCFWFSGSLPGVRAEGFASKGMWILAATFKAACSSRIVPILKALVMDGLLQMRLCRQSRTRWLIHGLIVWPFVFRFAWGMAALLGSLWAPERGFAWAMLDKNHPVQGLFFDLTGWMILAGAAMAILRSAASPSAKLPAMPRHDALAPGLVGAVVVVGYVLEGMRIAMTGYPPGSAYAFVGDAFSRLFFGVPGLEDTYGYVWYVHTVLTGAFVAYLPFSRMFHIFLAPVVIALNAADRGHAAAGR